MLCPKSQVDTVNHKNHKKFCNRKSFAAFSHSMNVKYSKIFPLFPAPLQLLTHPLALHPSTFWWMNNKEQTLCAKWMSKWNKSNNLNKLWCSPTHTMSLLVLPFFRFDDFGVTGLIPQQLPNNTIRYILFHQQPTPHCDRILYYTLNQMVYISMSPHL